MPPLAPPTRRKRNRRVNGNRPGHRRQPLPLPPRRAAETARNATGAFFVWRMTPLESHRHLAHGVKSDDRRYADKAAVLLKVW